MHLISNEIRTNQMHIAKQIHKNVIKSSKIQLRAKYWITIWIQISLGHPSMKRAKVRTEVDPTHCSVHEFSYVYSAQNIHK